MISAWHKTAENDEYLFFLYFVLSLKKLNVRYRQDYKNEIKKVYNHYVVEFATSRISFNEFREQYSEIFAKKKLFYLMNGKISANARLKLYHPSFHDALIETVILTDCKLNPAANVPEFYQDEIFDMFGEVVKDRSGNAYNIVYWREF